MTTRVVNRRVEDFDVAIDRSSKWGNPYSEKSDTKALFKVASRDEAIRNYRTWILSKPELLAALPELRGKRLGCWCKPRSCHGDVLVELLLEMEAGLRPWGVLTPPNVIVIDNQPQALVLPVKLNPEVMLLMQPANIELLPPSGDDLSFADVRIMLDGLIKRDCEAPSKEEYDRWAASPEGKAKLEEARVRKERIERGEIRPIVLHGGERHPDDGSGDFSFSMKMRMLDVTRAQLLELAADGWVFDEETMAWANEVESTPP